MNTLSLFITLLVTPASAAPANLDACGMSYVAGQQIWLSCSRVVSLEQSQVEAILQDIELNPPYFPKEGQRAEYMGEQIDQAKSMIDAMDTHILDVQEACEQAPDQAACAGSVAARNQKMAARIGALRRFTVEMERLRQEELAHPTPALIR